MVDSRFDRDQYAEAYPPGIERSWWHVARNAVIARTLAVHIPRTTEILEVGCGTGIVTCHLRARGWNVIGVDEGEPRNGLHCPEHLLLGTNATRLPQEQRHRVGALLLFDVIEHLADAPAFLREMLAAFPNAMNVVVSVPARAELWTNFDAHFGHCRRYDRDMLHEELAQAGTRTVSCRYFFHGVYPAMRINNLLRGGKRDTWLKAPSGRMAHAAHRLLGGLFAAEAALLPGDLIGTSMIAVAQRSTYRPS